jgi:hypothetical protein
MRENFTSETPIEPDASTLSAPGTRPKTISVPEAGRIYFDLGEWASYEAARRGEIPTIRIGRRLRVPVVALERMLDECGRHEAA